jgi:cyanophycin synthetase
MSFADDYMKSTYDRMDVKLDQSNMSIESTKTGKKVYYLYNTNPLSAREICNNKAITSQTLKAHDIPVADFILIRKSDAVSSSTLLDLEMTRKPLKFPLVIKPTDGTHGTDVIVGIQDIQELRKAVEKLLKKTDAIIIEKQLTGHDHRVLVVNDAVVDIVRRDYISIRGNGKNTIKVIINMRNERQKISGNHPTHNIDWALIKRESGGMDGNGVLPVNKEIMISNVRNYHNGANIVRVDIASVHPDNLKMLVKVNKAIGLNLAGVDFMTPDISRSYRENGGTIIEVNSNPGLDIHVNPKDNRSQQMGELVIGRLFSTDN